MSSYGKKSSESNETKGPIEKKLRLNVYEIWFM